MRPAPDIDLPNQPRRFRFPPGAPKNQWRCRVGKCAQGYRYRGWALVALLTASARADFQRHQGGVALHRLVDTPLLSIICVQRTSANTQTGACRTANFCQFDVRASSCIEKRVKRHTVVNSQFHYSYAETARALSDDHTPTPPTLLNVWGLIHFAFCIEQPVHAWCAQYCTVLSCAHLAIFM